MISIQYYKSPLGELILGSFGDSLCLCDWRYRKARDLIDTRIKDSLKADFRNENSRVIESAIKQLDEYFLKARKYFDVKLLMIGSPFQKRVWNELLNIPYGQTTTYADLSVQLGDLKVIRAVAGANGANALSIMVPCHRVVGKNGSLTGYAGGLLAKNKLLALESGNSHPVQLELF